METDSKLYIIMEYIPSGDLEQFFASIPEEDEDFSLKQNTVIYILVSLFHVLNYLHKEKNITHRDLKPANILIDKMDDENEKCYIKLTDFGFAAEGFIQDE